jgi:outer membrane receptor for ferrienterochelin and colicins
LGLTSDGKDQQYYNADDATRTGVDVMAQFRFKNGLTLKGAYAYIDVHSEVDGYNMASDRPHSLTFTANYSKTFGKVALNGRWMSSVETWYKNSAGGYVKNEYESRTFCSLNLGARFPRGFRFTAGIDNLFDFKDKNVTADQSVTPQRGIGFIGTLSVNIADLLKL